MKNTVVPLDSGGFFPFTFTVTFVLIFYCLFEMIEQTGFFFARFFLRCSVGNGNPCPNTQNRALRISTGTKSTDERKNNQKLTRKSREGKTDRLQNTQIWQTIDSGL